MDEEVLDIDFEADEKLLELMHISMESKPPLGTSRRIQAPLRQ